MNNFLQSIKNLSPGRLASISAILIFLMAFFIYMLNGVSGGEYTVLYTNLELGDAKQIVDKLESSKIKYRLSKNGTEILVPSEVVNKMRVETAELALPSKGSSVGYEIFDNVDALGSTNFVQNINLVRALEGELSRTIRGVDNIQSARVHLVLPKREMFSKEEQVPTASVIIKTKRGSLDFKNVQSIQKLVAAAVPKLEVKNVAIVDTSGNLLTDNYDNEETRLAASNVNNEIIRLDAEKRMENRINSLLEKVVGVGKVKSKVNIDMDFAQVVTNEEIYDPEGQVVRSSSVITEEGRNSDGEQPVSVSQNIPNGDTVSNVNGASSQNARTEETLNYEISKTIRNKVKSNGDVTRVSVAVMVDGIYQKGTNGEEEYSERTPAQMDKIASLVKSAVGYDANRGDTVEVENIRFVSQDTSLDVAEYATYFGFEKEDIIRIAEGLGVAIVAILVILLVIRPLINNAFDVSGSVSSEPALLGEREGDDSVLISNFINEKNKEVEELINLNKIDGRIKASLIKKINDIVERNPDTAVNIIRNWLYQNEN
ncbi:MAG: flagellar basal-body MS-ring/collar protein FliF [Alphaproteobacteria bacterium]